MIRPLCSKIIISYIFAISQFLLAANAWSPTDSYVPGTVSCPDDINLVREATSISQNESAWLEKRNKVTSVALKDFLTRATANFSDSSEVLSKLFNDGNSENLPKIAVAVSGGGYRSMLTGAGVLAAMDNRTEGAYEHGLGGLLQSTTYLSGASGGNWLVGTLALNNWTSVQDILNNMQNDDSIWDLSDSIVTPGGINIFKTAKRWDHISNAVESKQNADYNTSLADIWGRALAYNFSLL